MLNKEEYRRIQDKEPGDVEKIFGEIKSRDIESVISGFGWDSF